MKSTPHEPTAKGSSLTWHMLLADLPHGILNPYYQESLKNCGCGHHLDCSNGLDLLPVDSNSKEGKQ